MTRWSKALIAETGFGGYGIWWPNQDEARHYSGPFGNPDEAESRARDIAEFHGDTRAIEVVHALGCTCLRQKQPDKWHARTCGYFVANAG